MTQTSLLLNANVCCCYGPSLYYCKAQLYNDLPITFPVFSISGKVWGETLLKILNYLDLLQAKSGISYGANLIFIEVNENFYNFEGLWFIGSTSLNRCNWNS